MIIFLLFVIVLILLLGSDAVIAITITLLKWGFYLIVVGVLLAIAANK